MERKEDLPASGVMKGDEVPDTYRIAATTENMIHFGVSAPPVAPVVAPAEAPPAAAEAVTAPATSEAPEIGANASTEGKKKRGRPRKYGPDGALALSPTPISVSIPLTGEYSTWKNTRGPYKKKQKLEFHSTSGEGMAYSGASFTPHVITVNAGEDVSMKIISFSQQGSRAICILSANGAISNVTLRQPNSSGGTLTYEGHFEILSLSGSFMPTDSSGTKSRTGGMSVSLAGPDGRVMGGGLAGLLVAAGPVQVVIGSFLTSHQQQEQKPKKQKSELAPPFSPVPVAHNNSGEGANAVYTGPPRSITHGWYHGNSLGSGNTIHGQSITPAPYHGNNTASGNTFHGPSITAAAPHHMDNTGSENAARSQSITPAPYNGENAGSGSATPGRSITPASYHGTTVGSGNGQNIVAAENNTSLPGESKKPSPTNCMVSC